MKLGIRLTPIRLMVLTYFVLILVGTILLMMPFSVAGRVPLSLVDAFFMATSAVCVTGLIVQDTATYFSSFGQGVLLCLFQLGGLGIMTLYASLPILFGRQLKFAQRSTFSELFDIENYRSLKRILITIVQYTLIIEMLGTAILTYRFYTLWGDLKKAFFYGLFHSISAFCNAGFALFSNSFMDFNTDAVINLTLIVLIILGSLGFVTLQEIVRRKTFRKLSSYSKFVLVLTAILIFVPSFFVFHIEYLNAFAGMHLNDKVMASFFQVISTRTAGLNTIDISSLHSTTLFMFMIMMFIGGAPGGTAGGVKITTVGLLFLSLRSMFKGRSDIECYRKRVPPQVITKAIAIISISVSVVTLFILIMTLLEKAPFLEIFFEVLSAFGTAGLSMGLTPDLTGLGKVLISILMFLGRIGGLSLVFIISAKAGSENHRYSLGKFFVG